MNKLSKEMMLRRLCSQVTWIVSLDFFELMVLAKRHIIMLITYNSRTNDK